MSVFVAAILVCGLVALGIWAAVRPYAALVLLLALLVFHSGANYFLNNVVHLDNSTVVLLSAWKEAIVAGLVLAAALKGRRDGFRIRPAIVLAAAFLALIALRVVLDLAGHVSISDELLGARDASEFAFVFIAVSILAPDAAWLRRASWVLVPLIFLAAEAGLVQIMYGFPLDNWLFHGAGGQLASAFSAKFGGHIVPRVVGPYVAPNEFGLGLDVYLLAVLLPLALTTHNQTGRALIGIASGVSILALALTYSRSAWMGMAVAIVVVAFLLRSRLQTFVLAHRMGRPTRRRIVLAVIAVAAVVAIGGAFTLAGGPRFLVTTLTGQEASAAGRPSSLAKGIEELMHHPLGEGVTAAGPKALAINQTAVLTENWYLVYGIQLGWLALAALCALAASVLAALVTRAEATRTASDRLKALAPYQVGAAGALVAALVGALFIPALLDIPASLTLWIFVAAALSTGDERAASLSPTS